jgi:hypothetical protein
LKVPGITSSMGYFLDPIIIVILLSGGSWFFEIDSDGNLKKKT